MTSISFFGLNLFCILQLLVSTNSTHFHPPDHFNVAGNSPILKAEGEISDVGIAVQHAIILALRELNDKNDGIADDILPETVLQIALRSQLPYFKNGVETAERQVDAFDGEKLMGSIGPSDFEVLYGASRVFRDNHVAVIGYNDRHAALGLSDIFSNTLRTIPGYYIDGRILADVVESFHWEHVAVFSTSDTYGNMAKFFFEQEAKSKHLHILSDIHISPNTENFDEYLDQVKRDGAKIFVFLMHASVTAKLIKRGYERNIFNDHTQLLGAEHASDMDEWALVEPTLSSIMTGYMGVKYHSFPEDSEGKMRFIERFRNQESTLGDGVNCNNATDDTGYFLYMIDHDNDAGTPDVCTGLNFSVFHEDGSNIPSAAFYAYDATFALAYALHSLSYVHEVEFIDSESVKNELLQYVEFDGATGHIDFSTTFLDDGFDVGGRDEGLTFDLLNYDHKFETEEFKVVGAYHTSCRIEVISSTVLKRLLTVSPCSSIVASEMLDVRSITTAPTCHKNKLIGVE
jgi:ABC-type branched-subunit amino acid transport system substrate-binding protein